MKPACVGAVLMASGAGRRFGGNKLLTGVEGTPLIDRAMAALPPGLFARAVLVSRYGEILARGARAGYLALPNPGAEEGISASVRLGVGALSDMDGILFAVCDQPWLARASVEKLLAAFRAEPGRIAALGWQGRRGNPVVFPRRLFGELSALAGDIGGGAVVKRHPDLLTLVEAGSARELADVDAPEDLT